VKRLHRTLLLLALFASDALRANNSGPAFSQIALGSATAPLRGPGRFAEWEAQTHGATAQPDAVKAASVTSPPESSAFNFRAFFLLGIAHIWTGYDHLLFLFGLLIVCRRLTSIVAIVTCFTLAHSITLALATLDIVEIPGRVVEPMIAASIMFVGVENLLRRGAEPKGRWAVTFVFGLVHGFGFAGVLRDLGLGANGRSLALPLFAFNLGVEAGQVTIAALVLPVIWRLRKNETFVRRGIPVLSSVVALTGLYWFLERIFSTR
jgi:hydrogenase/urease accessory protein HupE